ncbi:MAG TPA: PilZ domain-containing protein [Malonomonas sp.]
MNSTADQKTCQPPADQRANLRAPLIIQKILIGSERPVFFGYSKNISRSGMFIATANPIKVGDQIDLQIPLPAPLSMTVKCHCEVVWKRPNSRQLPFEPGMGLKFLNLPEEIAALLQRWIEEQNG